MEKEEASGLGKRHLTLKDRAELEALYNKGSGVEEIAAKLNVHRSTVYNELNGETPGKWTETGASVTAQSWHSRRSSTTTGGAGRPALPPSKRRDKP